MLPLRSRARRATAPTALSIVAISLLAACSSSTSSTAPTSTAAASTPSAASSAPTASSAPAAGSAASAAPTASGAPWLGDTMARAIFPKKEDVAAILGSAVAKDPQVDAFTAKELVMSATVDPTTCTDAYALVWAFTAPKDTAEMTSANYAVGNSSLVISVGNAPDDLAALKKVIDACPQFTVSRTTDSSKYTVGDTLTQYATQAQLVSPSQLLIATGTSSQILTSTEDSCTATGSLSPSCIQTQSDRVFQDIRRVGPNLVSVWGVSSTELGGSPTADPQIPQQAVTTIANAMQIAVSNNASAAPSPAN